MAPNRRTAGGKVNVNDARNQDPGECRVLVYFTVDLKQLAWMGGTHYGEAHLQDKRG
jgi:hypothetical protein